MHPPNPRAWFALFTALLLMAGLRGVTLLWPADLAASSPELDTLRARRVRLSAYTDARLQALLARESTLRQELWTPASFAYWKKTALPDGWVLQDLGPADLKTCRAHRYAFTRPAATSAQWPEVTALLAALEARDCVCVQNVSLAAKPGYLGSRTFSQCVLVALFYFADDPPPGKP